MSDRITLEECLRVFNRLSSISEKEDEKIAPFLRRLRAQVEAEQNTTPLYDESGLIAGLKEAWLAMNKVEGYDALDEWQDKWWEFLWNEPEKAEGAGR